MMTIPAASMLNGVGTILIAGAGGGYDIYSGLPLYFALRRAGKRVHLANLSFATIYASSGRRHGTALVEVDAATSTGEQYFPELHLARWLKSQGEPDTVYCIDRVGAAPISTAYNTLCDLLSPDAVLLIDGGTDSLMRGDEPSLGTPQEDVSSLAAVQGLDLPTKILACIGFGIDTFHGVCHAYVLEAIAEITRLGGYKGTWSLLDEMPEVRKYRQATDYVFNILKAQRSIVNSSILAAVEGQFGNYHATNRTEGSELFINPLMSQYWFFDCDIVASRNLYIDSIRKTSTYSELSYAIEEYRATCATIRPWLDLPM